MADITPVVSRRTQPMPSMFNVLARYNAEHARGIVHTPEWQAKMADLQREYWVWFDADGRRRMGTMHGG